MNAVTGAGLYLSRFAVLFAVSVVFADLMARAGASPAALLGRRRPGGPGAALDRFGMGLLLGLFGLGTAYLGLALTGLFHRGPVLGLPLLLVAGSAATWRPASPLGRAVRELAGALDRGQVLLIVAAILPFTAMWVIPDTEQDSMVYHLGFPWQCLMSGRAQLDNVSLTFHVPLPVDLVYALPMAAGDERLCKWILLTWFAGAAAIFAAAQVRTGRGAAIGMFVLLMLASPNVHPLVTNTKNDLATAALLLAGAWRQLGGRWTSGALLVGCAAGAKFVLWPVAVLWALVMLPPRPVRWACAALLVVASVPWWMKTWLAIGNPFIPFATDRIPTLGWGPINRAVLEAGQRNLALPETLTWAGMPAGWLKQMAFRYLPLLLMLPGAVFLSARHRRAALVGAAGSFLILGLGHIGRYMLAPATILVGLAAEGLARLRGPLGARGRALLVPYAMFWVWYPQVIHPVVPLAFTDAATAHRYGFTTFADAIRQLERCTPRRFFQVGELRTHRIPGRACYDATSGETPFPWKVAHESRTPAEIAKRWRQMGAEWLLFNYVTVEWQSIIYWRFEWTEAALRRHVEFCKQYLSIAWRTETSDYLNGGFYIYRIARRPDPRPPKTIWFAPGTESLYGRSILFHNAGRQQDALNHYLAVNALLPDVGMSWNLVGHEYATMNQPQKAFEYLAPFTSQGMLDAMNLGEYGASAMRSGRLALAATVLQECLDRYPGHRNVILVNIGALGGARAIAALRNRDTAGALRALDEGEASLLRVPRGPNPRESNEVARRQTLAMLYGIRAEMAFAENSPVIALKYFRLAAETAPDSQGVDRWKQAIAALEPRPFGGR